MRHRLPNRRPSETCTLETCGQTIQATVGFHPDNGAPQELFLTAGKEGSLLNHLLSDAAIVISVALQHHVPIEALARSMSRVEGSKEAASPIGASLDMVLSLIDEQGN